MQIFRTLGNLTMLCQMRGMYSHAEGTFWGAFQIGIAGVPTFKASRHEIWVLNYGIDSDDCSEFGKYRYTWMKLTNAGLGEIFLCNSDILMMPYHCSDCDKMSCHEEPYRRVTCLKQFKYFPGCRVVNEGLTRVGRTNLLLSASQKFNLWNTKTALCAFPRYCKTLRLQRTGDTGKRKHRYVRRATLESLLGVLSTFWVNDRVSGEHTEHFLN
jgi:hypothetical protein